MVRNNYNKNKNDDNDKKEVKCKLVELVQYQCNIESTRILCIPFTRIFKRLSRNKDARSFTYIYIYIYVRVMEMSSFNDN